MLSKRNEAIKLRNVFHRRRGFFFIVGIFESCYDYIFLILLQLVICGHVLPLICINIGYATASYRRSSPLRILAIIYLFQSDMKSTANPMRSNSLAFQLSEPCSWLIET